IKLAFVGYSKRAWNCQEYIATDIEIILASKGHWRGSSWSSRVLKCTAVADSFAWLLEVSKTSLSEAVTRCYLIS
ncbi:hypothetical protein A2U01_0052339, partial [Trifolium medium]|nr:hypothetical protein [Trifolium medium]